MGALQGMFLALVALAMFYQVASRWVERERCPYCGVIVGHEDSCPYQIGEP